VVVLRRAVSRSVIVGVVVVLVLAILGVSLLTGWFGRGVETTTTPTTAPVTTQTTVTAESPRTPVSAKDVLKVAIGIDLDTVDPHGQTTTVVYNVVRHMYETLLWYDEKGNVIPWLAERWEVSPDGLTYTLYLRKGVRFHDGSELDAYAVKANVDRWVDPTVRVPARAQLGPVKGAEVVDKYTVKIMLKEPFAPFLRALASYLLIASPKVIEKYGNKTITEPVGTGPYKFVSWEKGKKVVLEANEDYWGSKPLIKRIEWVIIPDATTRTAALLAGDVDFAYNLPPTELERVKGDARFQVLTPVSNRVIFIAMLPKGPLADPRVRQALNHAVDKSAIIQNILFGLGVELKAPIPDHFFGFYPMKPYSYDLDKARKLLAEAGYPQGFKVVLLHPTGRYLQDKQVAEAVQAYLSRIGVQVELKTMDWPSFVAEITKPFDQKTYDMVLLGWGPGVADAHFTLHGQFYSGQAPPKGLAAAHYSNPTVDRLLEEAMREVDEGKRRELYRQATEIIWNEAPWIFLYTQAWFYAGAKSLKGLMVYVDGEQIFFHKAYFS
jgi:peptide/nickel transport system substrate-binding protein